MKWITEYCCFLKRINYGCEISKFGSSCHCMSDGCQHGIRNTEIISNLKCSEKKYQIGSFSPIQLQHSGFGSGIIRFSERSLLVNNVLHGFERHYNTGSCQSLRNIHWTIFRQFGQTTQEEPRLSRDRLVQLWLKERKLKNSRLKRKSGGIQHFQSRETIFQNQTSFQLPFRRWFVDESVAEERSDNPEKLLLKQPPLSQSPSDFLEPTSPEELKVASLLSRANLLITRDIEWANLMLGFEQENRYAIVDACHPQRPVGFISEQSNVIFRQLLRTRRPFVAYITDAMGNELFRVRRPIWLINSTIYAEVDGKEIGVVHRRWHLWRRVYDLYLGKKQFAVVQNPGFWNWTFTLKDIDGNVLGEINRDWRGIGFELLTDAGQYVIRFGHADQHSKTGPASAIQELQISRPLTISERAVAVALAVSLDNDYFSRHGGWGIPFIVVGE